MTVVIIMLGLVIALQLITLRRQSKSHQYLADALRALLVKAAQR